MPKITIDGVEIEVEAGTSILQACEQLGKEIPRFCYHDKLSVPANCRMCLVELENAPKPVASCAMPCGDGMVVHTASEKVKKARKGIMEMLLINHPLDCPICDQGGECDLQDQAVAFGFDRSRYAEAKRAVTNKELGPIVNTIMTRCIHCTRCVRFSEEIAGVGGLGLLNRGSDVEIGTYIEAAVDSELSGNLVDVCPVGALTSKPYQFKARPWEMTKTETIDVMDAVGSNIRMDSRSGEVLRVLPRLNEDVNEEWISDKTRYAFDGLATQRLDKSYVRNSKGKLVPASWEEALNAIKDKVEDLDGKEIAALVGDMASAEAVKALKDLMEELGSPHTDCRMDGMAVDPKNRSGYLFNTGIAGIENADAILIVGANPRYEATMVNARIRKATLHNNTKVALINKEPLDLTYDYEYLGAGAETLEGLLTSKAGFAKVLKEAENPMIILGSNVLSRSDALAIQAIASKLVKKYDMIKDGWNGYNVLHTAASRVGALDLGFVPKRSGYDTETILKAADKKEIKFVYLLNVDNIDVTKLKKSFVVYQGHHGDVAAHIADVILPGASYAEENATFVNMEGRVQRAFRSVHPVGDAKANWKIIRALSDVLHCSLPYDHLNEVRDAMVNECAHFADVGMVYPAIFEKTGLDGKCLKAPFVPAMDKADFYQSNVIARYSKTMADCIESFVKQTDKKKSKRHG